MKILFYILVVLCASALLASDDVNTYSFLEEHLLDILAAVLGGLLAAVSIIVGIISTSSDEVKSVAAKSSSFGRFIVKLGRDMNILISCLLASIFLPYIRKLNIAIPIDINGQNILTHFQYLISVLEIFVLIISFCIIFEISSVLYQFLNHWL